MQKRLDARLALATSSLRILVDDRKAVYPIVVDPLMTSPAWTAESDQASALFGASVAIAGDVNGDAYNDVIVGAYRYHKGQTDEEEPLCTWGRPRASLPLLPGPRFRGGTSGRRSLPWAAGLHGFWGVTGTASRISPASRHIPREACSSHV